MTPEDYARARRLLLRRDPVLAALIRKHGACGLAAAQRSDHFSALVRAITGQQLSTKAAATIYARLVALMPGGVTPEALASLSDDQMRAVGMSRQKTAYFRDLAGKVLSGALPINSLDEMSDDGVIAALTQVKGIGRWSAQMFLMFRLGRMNVLPDLDLGVQKGIQIAYRMRKLPRPQKVLEIGAKWTPYRTIGSWYMWRVLELPSGSFKGPRPRK